MSLNQSRLAYEDHYGVMDKALVSKHGIRVGFTTEEEAKFYRMEMNQARQLDRRFNSQRYKSDHPMHQHSEYDALTFRIRMAEGKYWVYAERKPMRGAIEEITEEDKTPIKQIASFRRF